MTIKSHFPVSIAICQDTPTPRFLIIKPHGLDWQTECETCIEEEHGLEVLERHHVSEWSKLAPMLYAKHATPDALEHSIRKSAAFRQVHQRDEAVVVVVKDTMEDDLLMRIKYKLRARFPSHAYTYRSIVDTQRIVSTVVHVSDDVDRAREWFIIQQNLNTISS